jgi:hypothetical protein
MQEVTPQQVTAAIEMAKAFAAAIRELGSVPSGHLYARVQDRVSLASYEAIIDTLIRAKVVRRDGSHLLTWIGR